MVQEKGSLRGYGRRMGLKVVQSCFKVTLPIHTFRDFFILYGLATVQSDTDRQTDDVIYCVQCSRLKTDKMSMEKLAVCNNCYAYHSNLDFFALISRQIGRQRHVT